MAVADIVDEWRLGMLNLNAVTNMARRSPFLVATNFLGSFAYA